MIRNAFARFGLLCAIVGAAACGSDDPYAEHVGAAGQAVGAPLRYDSLADSGDYVLDGRKWSRTTLSYFFQNGTDDIAGTAEQQAVRDAMTLWSSVSTLTFTQATSAATADIIIQWGTGDHGDGNAFDGVNGVLAHAYYPPPNGGALAGDAHFDDAETWTLSARDSSAQPIDLVTVAAHEIGHSLGLGHSTDVGALMYAFYGRSHRSLGPDDIAGIQALYGSAQHWNQIPGLAYDISVGANGAAWLIGTNNVGSGGDHGVFRWTGSTWEEIDGGGVRIAVDPSGAPWVVNAAHQIFRRSGSAWVQLPGLAYDIGIGANGTAWVIGTNNVGNGSDHGVFRWTGSTWEGIDGGGVRVAVDPSGAPWVVNAAHQIFRRSGSAWVQLPGLAYDIGIGANGAAWVIGTNNVGNGDDHGVFRWTGSTWEGIDGGGVGITVGPNGLPWLLNAATMIFRRQ